MSKTMKQIGTIFAAATMVGATLTGAIAADLKDLPAPFVKDGKADVTIVVGASAATADVLGSIDIASALQAASVTTETVSVGGGKTQSASAGVKVESSGNSLLLGDSLSSVETTFDDKDFPELLASGTVTEQDDNTDYDYDQSLSLGTDVKVRYDADDSDMKDPVLYLDLDTNTDILWNYTLDFKGKNLNISALGDSESVTMLGKTFTFDPNTAASGEIKLFGSDKTEYMTLNEPKTFTVEGKSYTVEVTGGNSDNDNVVVSVNGVSKTVQEGDTQTINGLEIYAKDVFVTNIPTLSAAATLFIGSEELVLQGAASSPSFSDVEISGDTVNGLSAAVYGASNGAVDKIIFQFQPSDLSNDLSGFDEVNYLEAGKSVVDPLFGTFKVSFAGGNYALDDSDKAAFSLKNSGNDVEFSFDSNTGDSITFKPFKLGNTSNLTGTFNQENKGYNGTGGHVVKNQIFLLNEGSSDIKTYAFEVVGFSSENSVNQTRLKNLGTGQTEKYSAGDKIVDGVTVSSVNLAGDDSFELSSSAVDKVYLKGGKSYIQLDTSIAQEATKTFTLTEADHDQATLAVLNFTATVDTADNDVKVQWADTPSNSASGIVFGDNDDGADNKMGLTQYGSYVTADIDNYDSVEGYVPQDQDGEVTYGVFFAPTDATVSTTGGSTVTTQKVNPIAVGTAVLDSSVSLASESKNLIVVGGPCANSVAAALLKSAKDNCGAGFTPGKAVVQLFDTPMGKTAMLVAGYEATETQAASRAVALMDKRLVGKSVTLTVTNTNDFTISSSQ